MITKYFNKSISILLTLIFIFGLFPPVLFAQPNNSQLGEIKGFNRSVFESHFSRADRELNPERWLSEAKLGITQAIHAWEMVALGLYDNPLLFAEAKNLLEKWSDEELEQRFSKWLIGRFFGEAAEKALMEYSAIFAETQKNYLWHLDNEGNIIFDAQTGDPLVIRPFDDGREFSIDLLMWQDEAENHLISSAYSFNVMLTGLFTELLAYIPEGLRETMGEVIRETGVNINGMIKREFENIAAREERIFTSRRTRDIFSLRKQSDNEAARVFTQRLIAEIEETNARGIEELKVKIEEAAAGTGDLALLGDEWLRLYKEQFDRGLRAWEQAEERFFIRRIEWEQDSLRLFSEGEEIWFAAFNQFEEERKKWELNAKELFDSGVAMFKNTGEEFEKNIAEARQEFELNMAMRIGEGTTKVKALVDMYLICSSAAITAMESMQFWYNQYNSANKVDPKNPGFNAWLTQEQGRTNNKTLTEIRKSYDLYVSYMEKAIDARDRILANYAELLGTGALKDILSPDVSSEDFCLDEYQIALIRAKALVLYWERKTEIADAVLAYADDLSAQRITESEGNRIWENAKSSYNESLAVYEAELNKLNTIGEDINKQQEILHNLGQELLHAEKILNKLNSEYSTLVASFVVNRSDFFLLELNTVYEYLTEEYRLFQKTGDEAAYNTILEYGMKWDITERRETAEYVLDLLINGDDDQILSLTELEKNVREGKNPEVDLKIRLAGIELFADNYSDQLRPYDSAYSGADWYSKVKNVNFTQEEKSILYGEKLYAQLLADYNNSFAAFLEIDPEHHLADYFYYELYFNAALLDIYSDYLNISSFGRDELWRDTCEALNIFFAGYGLIQTGNTLPDPKSILESINKKPGNFLQNVSQFLIEIDNCFNMIPHWIEYEIENWKTALIEYFAAYVFSLNIHPKTISETLVQKQAELEKRYNELYEYAESFTVIDENEAGKINAAFEEIRKEVILLYYIEQITYTLEKFNNDAIAAGNDKHWRQFLLDDYINDNDPALIMSSSWKDGVLADALFNAAYYTNRINDSFELYSQKNIDYSEGSAELFFNHYLYEVSVMINRFNVLNVLYTEISKTGRAFELSRLSPIETEGQLKTAYEALKTQEEIFSALRDEYFRESEIFLITGSLYDEQYSILKKAHDITEQRRFEYEKQDTIQRWASTAYINTDHIDLENSKSNLTRAQTVLTVLSDLYSGESRRNYENPEYNALYSEYEQSFKTKLKTLEAAEAVILATTQEKINNEKIFIEYQNTLHQLGYANREYSNYVSPASSSQWSLKDIITVKNGQLAFSRNDSMALSGVDAVKAQALIDFFETKIQPDDERFEISLFENSLRELNQRLAFYFSDSNKFRQWSLARDYLITSLMNVNRNLPFLNSYYSGMGQMTHNGSIGSLNIKTSFFSGKTSLYSLLHDSPVHLQAENIFYNAWAGLSEKERADLEFYVILTLSGIGNNYISGFSQAYTLDVYNNAYNYVYEQYMHAVNELNKKWKSVIGGMLLPGAGTVRELGYREMRDVNQLALNRIEPVLSETSRRIQNWTSGLQRNIISIQNYSAVYGESCKKLDVLEGIKTNGEIIQWSDLYLALLYTKMLNETEISELKNYWDIMQSESNKAFSNVSDALSGLVYWAKDTEERNKQNLANLWQQDVQTLQINENNFNIAIDDYMKGIININTLKTAAENAYGKNAAAWKNHFENLHVVMHNDLSLYINAKFDFYSEFSALEEEITTLTAKTLENRYIAELTAREIEWNQTRQDIEEKYNAWLDSAEQIIENGRTDWITSVKKMEEAYKQWKINFQNEYSRVSDEWAEAYLAGLEDKEKWLEHAALAVNQASAESFLLLVGTEGERLSRFMDTREPFGIRDAAPEAKTLMAELLQSSGIANMYNLFGSISNMTVNILPLARQGLKSFSAWDSALARTAATDMARKVNTEIMDIESRKLAYNVRLTIDEAIKNLTDNIDSANKGFRKNIDDMFILSGNWTRYGNDYSKEVVKGSTLFTPVITSSAIINGYKDYKMEPVSLLTNLDEIYLASLNTIAIRGLLENAYFEIGKIAEEIFGIGKNAVIIEESYYRARELSPGKFGAHLGYEPAVKPGNEMGKTWDSLFFDAGAGEIGRLVSSFIYYSVVDAKGMAEVAIPAWDKRMWDDEFSSFKAPSARSTFQIVNAIGAVVVTSIFTYGAASVPATMGIMALGVGINTTDDLIFAALDVSGGYKSFDEAGFEFGKSVLINTASAAVSGAFSGFGSAGNAFITGGLKGMAANTVSSTAGKVLVNTAMTGAQALTTGLVTSTINGITYNRSGGFGYYNDIFKTGMIDTFKSTASSIVSTLTTQSLTAINSGLINEKLTGFNPNTNMKDLSRFNNFAGSLAGQGINYAMGDDFTLNLLNLSLLTNGKLNSGLLELHFGHDGVSMNFGTGGADVSLDNIAAAFRGALVWGVNSQINSYIRNNDFDSAIALRAQYGFGYNRQRDQLWEILMGNTLLRPDADGDFMAETSRVDGKRVVNISGYQSDLSVAEQMFLALVLGHEAYRDGYVTGDIDASGNVVTAERSFNEFMEASIARIMMGERINQGYNWFFGYNVDFAFESFLLDLAKKSGNFSLLEDYLTITYGNDQDYFFQKTSTGNNFQNEARYNIPLLDSPISEAEADKENLKRYFIAYEKYFLSLKTDEEKTIAFNKFSNDKKLQQEHGYIPVAYETLYLYGCMFMSVKYGIEAITGKSIDTVELHDFITKNNLHLPGANLSNELMAGIMTKYLENNYNVNLTQTGIPTFNELYELEQSETMYLAHLRIKKEGTGDGYHSVMVSGIEFTYDDNGEVTGIGAIHVANPWDGNNFTGKTSYTMDQIARWDIFKVEIGPNYRITDLEKYLKYYSMQ